MENGLKELQQRLVEMLSSFQKFTQQNGMIFFLVGSPFSKKGCLDGFFQSKSAGKSSPFAQGNIFT